MRSMQAGQRTGPATPVVEKVDVLKDICVTQRETFGTAGWAACVDESEDRFRVVDVRGSSVRAIRGKQRSPTMICAEGCVGCRRGRNDELTLFRSCRLELYTVRLHDHL